MINVPYMVFFLYTSLNVALLIGSLGCGLLLYLRLQQKDIIVVASAIVLFSVFNLLSGILLYTTYGT